MALSLAGATAAAAAAVKMAVLLLAAAVDTASAALPLPHSPVVHGYSPVTPAYHHHLGAPNHHHYAMTPAYPAYGYSPGGYGHHAAAPPPPPVHYAQPKEKYGAPPACSTNTTALGASWCLHDGEYPTYDVQHAIEYHYAAVAALYKDVIANTDNSVDILKHRSDETYLCPALTSYVTPLRAVNVEGKWRVIVNGVKAHYETLSQTARIEECANPGYPCPLVAECYDTKCLQKYAYHRFLIYDPHDYYFPFSVDSFKLPSACACFNGAYKDQHH